MQLWSQEQRLRGVVRGGPARRAQHEGGFSKLGGEASPETSRHPDLELSVPRAVRKCISVVQATLSVVFCYGHAYLLIPKKQARPSWARLQPGREGLKRALLGVLSDGQRLRAHQHPLRPVLDSQHLTATFARIFEAGY